MDWNVIDTTKHAEHTALSPQCLVFSSNTLFKKLPISLFGIFKSRRHGGDGAGCPKQRPHETHERRELLVMWSSFTKWSTFTHLELWHRCDTSPTGKFCRRCCKVNASLCTWIVVRPTPTGKSFKSMLRTPYLALDLEVPVQIRHCPLSPRTVSFSILWV